MTLELRFAAASLGCLVLVALLGIFVSTRTPTRLDVEAIALRGRAVPLAAAFTLLGRWYSVTLVLALGFFIVLALRVDPRPLIAIAVAQAGSQTMSALFKSVFHRVRPDHWLLWQEPDRSYPSGHATTGIAFYLGLLVLLQPAQVVPHPIWVGASIALGACAVGLPWSRLSLGAHYLSDVAGGMLLGAAWLFALLAVAANRV